MDWQTIKTAPRGAPLLGIDGPILEVRHGNRRPIEAYFGIGKDGMGPRWNDRNGLAMQEPAEWRRIQRAEK